MKNLKTILTVIAAAIIILVISGAAVFASDARVIDLTPHQKATWVERLQHRVEQVTLSGKLNHFGIPDYHATVPGAAVWIAEYPETKDAGVISGADGWWTMHVLKYQGRDLEISFVYEKEGWVTTKTSVLTVTDEDDTDLAIQFIDPEYYHGAMVPLVESMLAAFMPPGAPAKMNNAMVATVGKSFASMHDDRLPHGDPGATVSQVPGAIGPIYFDRHVRPNLEQKSSSVDGGVAWINVPPGVYMVTANKEGVEYEKVKFIIDETDAQAGIILYIASPPNSLQGTNDSAPGKP